MADLAFCSFAEQLGVTHDDHFVVLDLPSLFLVSFPHDMAPNTIAEIEGGYACWLTPQRRLVVSATPPEGFASDVSEGSAVFVITAHEDALLAMASPLPRAALAEGHCAQTLFAGLRVLMYHRGGALYLHVERSLAAYLRDWLRRALTAL